MIAIVLREPGVAHAVSFPGLSINGFVNSPNSGIVFVGLSDFSKDGKTVTNSGRSAWEIAAALNQKFARSRTLSSPCSRRRPSRGWARSAASRCRSRIARASASTRSTPRRRSSSPRAERDPSSRTCSRASRSTRRSWRPTSIATRRKSQGVALSDLFETMQMYLGSLYVNDFNRFGRTYQVNAQADMPFRLEPDDILRLKVRNAAGEMVPLGSFVTLEQSAGPSACSVTTATRAAEITGGPAPGFSLRPGAGGDRGARGGRAAERPRATTGPSSPISNSRRQHGCVDLSAVRAARVPRARRAVRKLVAAARRDPDRADVPALRHRGRVAHRRRQQHLHADRTHRARRARVQERDPDRRVRADARARRARARGTRCSRRASCACARS